MRRFRFQLEPILQQRKWLEQQCSLEFAQAQRQEAEEQQRFDAIHQEYRNCQQVLDQTKREHFDVVQIQAYIAHLDRIAAEREQQAILLQQASEARAKAHARWVEADRDLKVVDKMREHALDRYQVRYQSEAQNLLDEIGARRRVFQNVSER